MGAACGNVSTGLHKDALTEKNKKVIKLILVLLLSSNVIALTKSQVEFK